MGDIRTTIEGTRPCDLAEFHTATPFYVAQTRDVELELPEGHGIRLEPESYVGLWGHFDNISPCPIYASAAGIIEFTEPGAMTQEVANFNVENWGLNIPLRDRSDSAIACDPAEWHTEELTCVIPEDMPYIEIIAMTPHFHAAGRRFEVRLFDGEVVRPEPLLVNDDWQHAPLTTLFGEGEAIRLEPGQGLSIRCQYYYSCEEHLDNTPGTSCPPSLRGGPEAASEMCSLKTWYRGPVVRDVDSGEPRCF